MVRVLVTKERSEGETRVSATPDTVKQMLSRGLEIAVEAGAGENAFIGDHEYEKEGATIAKNPREAWASADVVLKVRAPIVSSDFGGDELDALKPGSLLVGLLSPWSDIERVRRLAERDVSAVAMELVPRITRAQKMDALSSQASIAGYKAVLLAAAELPKYFPMLMTAAGTVRPARVVVLGAGVAGLQAIATARRLGAVVEASDVRPAVKEQVESLGARFIEPPERAAGAEDAGGYAREVGADYLKRQQQIVGEHLAAADVVITTALVPGKRAPLLVPADIVARMKPGSVIVDMAVEQGGNCELSEAGQNVRRHGVLIVGHKNLAATMPADASLLYARNVLALLEPMVKKGELTLDAEEEIMSASLIAHAGRVSHLGIAEQLGLLCVVPAKGREAA
jgi:H+-translocating NAD(P) transhydrogenase subunit alpha